MRRRRSVGVLCLARVVAEVVRPHPADVEHEAAGLAKQELAVRLVELLLESEPGNLKKSEKVTIVSFMQLDLRPSFILVYTASRREALES